jgi:hypothetical protein
MYNPYYNTIPHINREIRRKVEKYRKKHPDLTFTQAYNKVYGTNYDEPKKILDTTFSNNSNKKELKDEQTY